MAFICLSSLFGGFDYYQQIIDYRYGQTAQHVHGVIRLRKYFGRAHM